MTRLIQRTFQENGQVTLTTLTGPGYKVLKRRGGFLETDPFDYQSSNIDQMKPRLYKLNLDNLEHEFGFSFQREDVLSIKSVKKSSPADESGIREGDIVLELNGQYTNNLSSNQIKEIIEDSKRERKLDILVIDIDGYRFSVKHAVPINSLLSFVQTKKRSKHNNFIC
jgi:predicted metalloprotease with PDZ domain